MSIEVCPQSSGETSLQVAETRQQPAPRDEPSLNKTDSIASPGPSARSPLMPHAPHDEPTFPSWMVGNDNSLDLFDKHKSLHVASSEDFGSYVDLDFNTTESAEVKSDGERFHFNENELFEKEESAQVLAKPEEAGTAPASSGDQTMDDVTSRLDEAPPSSPRVEASQMGDMDTFIQELMSDSDLGSEITSSHNHILGNAASSLPGVASDPGDLGAFERQNCYMNDLQDLNSDSMFLNQMPYHHATAPMQVGGEKLSMDEKSPPSQLGSEMAFTSSSTSQSCTFDEWAKPVKPSPSFMGTADIGLHGDFKNWSCMNQIDPSRQGVMNDVYAQSDTAASGMWGFNALYSDEVTDSLLSREPMNDYNQVACSDPGIVMDAFKPIHQQTDDRMYVQPELNTWQKASLMTAISDAAAANLQRTDWTVTEPLSPDLYSPFGRSLTGRSDLGYNARYGVYRKRPGVTDPNAKPIPSTPRVKHQPSIHVFNSSPPDVRNKTSRTGHGLPILDQSKRQNQAGVRKRPSRTGAKALGESIQMPRPAYVKGGDKSLFLSFRAKVSNAHTSG